MIIFFASRIAGLVIDSIVLTVCLKIFLFPSMISKFISTSSTTYINYCVGKFIFKNKN